MAQKQLQLRQLQPSQIRDSDDGSLTITGLAVPYGQPLEYAGMVESFSAGAFDPDQVKGSPLLWSHERSEQLGHITDAGNSPDGLEIEARILPTSRGQDIQKLVKAGSLTGMSVGFDPLEWDTSQSGETIYQKAKLWELSLTPLPAYEQAQISATRQEGKPVEAATQSPAPAAVAAPEKIPQELAQRLDQLEARMVSAATPEKALEKLRARDAFCRQLEGSRDTRQLRALSDVLSSGNQGILPPAWSSEVRDTLDSERYMFPRLGKMAFPASGYTLTVPKILTHASIGPRGAEKTQVPTGPLTTGQDIYTATWYAGAVDIAMELVSQSDPSVLALVVDSLLSTYAAVTDTALTLAVAGAGTATGAALPVTGFDAFLAAVLDTGEEIRAATGTFGDHLCVTTATWGKLLAMVDDTGRRIMATSGPMNADGSAQLTAGSVNLGGLLIFHNPRAQQDVQYNLKSARVAEKPPTQLQAVNVEKLGYDVGVYGAVLDLPLYPAGIKRYSVTATREAPAGKR